MKDNTGSTPYITIALVALIAISLFIGGIFLPLGPFLIEAVLLIAAGVMAIVVTRHSTMNAFGESSGENTPAKRQDELSSVIGALQDAFVVYNANFEVQFFNPAAEELFNLKSQDVVGHKLSPRDVEKVGWRPLAQVVFPSLAPQVVALSPEGHYPTIAEVSFSDPELELRITTMPIINAQTGKPTGFMKLIRNLTPEIEALKAKEDFITVASHQLRGPVTDINWALEALAGATELSDTNRSIVQNAAAASKGLLRRVEDFLDLSRMEGGRLAYVFAPVDISAFLDKTLTEIMPAANTAGIKLYFDKPNGTLPIVNADERQISIVVVNLIENAIRYNIQNGEVIVKAETMGDKPFVEVTVRDTGIGIPSDAIPKLFTKFYRAENAVKSQTEGSGIGLYVAREIVRAHGGDIWVESELGRGTAVHFTLPIAQGA